MWQLAALDIGQDALGELQRCDAIAPTDDARQILAHRPHECVDLGQQRVAFLQAPALLFETARVRYGAWLVRDELDLSLPEINGEKP